MRPHPVTLTRIFAEARSRHCFVKSHMNSTFQISKSLSAWSLAGLAAGLAALVALPPVAQAQDRSWQVADGAWNFAPNWVGTGVPAYPYSAWINNSGTVRVGAGVSASASTLYLGSTNGGGNTFSLEGGSFLSNQTIIAQGPGSAGTASVSSGTWANMGVITVGNLGTGRFLMSGGLVSTGAVQLGVASGGVGTMAVTGGTLAASNHLMVGGNGTGSLTIDSSGLVTSGTVIVAAGAGSSGSITLSGTAFLNDVTSSGTLATGQVMSGSGQGTFHSSGGTLRLTQNQSALFDGFETGDVTIGSGGFTIDTANYNVGIATGIVGTGTLVKVGSGTLTLTGSNSYGGGTDYDGGTNVQEGTLLVTDGGSLSNGGYVLVSGSQSALLEVNDGSVNVHGIEVARQGVGTLSISGSNTQVSSSEFIIGRSGTGTMYLSSGYVSTERAIIATGDSGTALVTGGTWAIANDFNVGWGGSGDLQISGGLVSSGSAIICTLGNTSTALVSGGTWNVSSSLTVGRRGNATLTISGTGLVDAGEVILGGSSQGTGILNLNSGVLATGSIIEGSGTGTVNFNGGTLRLTQNQAALFDGFETGDVTIGNGGGFLDTAGYNAGIATSLVGTGTLTKVGTGTLTLTGSNSHGGTDVLDGTLVVDGGSLNNSGFIKVGGSQGATMEVKSGSVRSYRLEVGNSSTGTLKISSGYVSNNDVRIGNDSINANGTAIVTGGTWAVDNFLGVASFTGTGRLELSGGVISSDKAGFAEQGGHGTALVSGGTWNNSDTFRLGIRGTGILTISGSGLVNTPEVIVGTSISGLGTLNLNGGVLATGSIIEQSGTGTVNLNGGLLRLTQNQSALFAGFETGDVTIGNGGFFLDTNGHNAGIATSLVGTGTLTKVGSGTLTITGSHGYTGGTTVSDGTLLVDGGSLDHGGGIHVSGSAGQNAIMEVKSGSVTSSSTEVGYVSSGLGTLSISGSDTRVSTGFLRLGSTGTGTLNLSSGYLSSGTAIFGSGGGLGIATVSGGTWSMGATTLGFRGWGTLTITDGLVTADFLEIGRDRDSSVVVNGGRLEVGQLRTGSILGSSFTINSGTVTTAYANLGYSYSAGATVTGGSWTVTDSLHVGVGGSTLMEMSGGLVTSATSYIASSVGSGTALVSGGTWNTNSLFTVGGGGNGTLTISGSGLVSAREMLIAGNSGGTGVLNLNGGVLATGNLREGAGTGTVNLNGGLLRLTQNQSALFAGFETGDITIGAGGFFLDTNGHNTGIATSLVGTGTLTKMGSGTLALTGSNSYSGGTKIEAGTLIISDLGASASVLGTGDVTVGENGKLAGVGTVLGDTFVAGTLAPGNSPGEMTFAGNLLLESTAVVQMELASAISFDQITVGGLLTYDGTLTITFLGGYIPAEGVTFALFEAGSVAPGSKFDNITFSDSGYTGSLDYTTGILTVTAVPEPTAAALLVLGAAGLLARRRRR
jgi:fibronectin-binding autotransporter adhesin